MKPLKHVVWRAVVGEYRHGPQEFLRVPVSKVARFVSSEPGKSEMCLSQDVIDEYMARLTGGIMYSDQALRGIALHDLVSHRLRADHSGWISGNEFRLEIPFEVPLDKVDGKFIGVVACLTGYPDAVYLGPDGICIAEIKTVRGSNVEQAEHLATWQARIYGTMFQYLYGYSVSGILLEVVSFDKVGVLSRVTEKKVDFEPTDLKDLVFRYVSGMYNHILTMAEEFRSGSGYSYREVCKRLQRMHQALDDCPLGIYEGCPIHPDVMFSPELMWEGMIRPLEVGNETSI